MMSSLKGNTVPPIPKNYMQGCLGTPLGHQVMDELLLMGSSHIIGWVQLKIRNLHSFMKTQTSSVWNSTFNTNAGKWPQKRSMGPLNPKRLISLQYISIKLGKLSNSHPPAPQRKGWPPSGVYVISNMFFLKSKRPLTIIPLVLKFFIALCFVNMH